MRNTQIISINWLKYLAGTSGMNNILKIQIKIYLGKFIYQDALFAEAELRDFERLTQMALVTSEGPQCSNYQNKIKILGDYVHKF